MMLQPTARDKGLSMLIDYDIFLPTLLVGDPGRIRQILTRAAKAQIEAELKSAAVAAE